MSSKRINSATFEAFKNRGAIRKLEEQEDEAPLEVARVDERGRNPLHRLIISMVSDRGYVNMRVTHENQSYERLDLIAYGFLLGPENFMESLTATDYKGRTPLHYAVMPPSDLHDWQVVHDIVRLLLKLGSNINAADMYGKTPLHYTEMNDHYELLVQHGADENTKDKHGYKSKDLKQLRDLVTINEENAKKLPSGERALYPSIDYPRALNLDHVTELSKRKAVETIRIYSQSPRQEESSEEAIWKIWTENEFIRLNRRPSQLNPLIQHFFDRLADGIKERDWRFECQPILVGSAEEETKAVLSADFDFNFKLIKFSQFCDPFPHPLGPKGYFELRRKPNEDTKSRSDETFDSFFNLDHCLLTYEVNSRFKIILEEVLSDPAFWKDEHLFDWNVTGEYESKYKCLHRLCMTMELRMINPIEDGEGGFLFVKISIDIVACVHVEGWWPEDPLPVGMSPDLKNGCTFVFDYPHFDASKLRHAPFSETFARISFARLESRIIKESSPLIKAAYILCKMMLYNVKTFTYQLKTCLFFCMETLNARNGSETRNEDEITPKQLAVLVERIMFCFVEFYRHGVCPCYFMPSFRRPVVRLSDGHLYMHRRKEDTVDVSSENLTPFSYPIAYDYYLDLCPDDTTIDIPIIVQREHLINAIQVIYPVENIDPEL